MVYLSADDTDPAGAPVSGTPLENFSIDDFNEMEQVGSGPNVNVVVQWDRGTFNDMLDQAYGSDPTQSWQTCRRYYVVADPNQANLTPQPIITDPLGMRIFSPMLQDLGEVAMGEEDTLVEFVQWAISRFPADRYMLVLWNHGAGWKPRSPRVTRGIIFDEIGPQGPSFLTNAALASAMRRIKQFNGGRNLDIVALDASGMGLLEVHYQMREGVDYLISTFLFGPGDGFPYNIILDSLTKNPRQTTEAFIRKVVEDYVASYQTGQPTVQAGSVSVTLGATDQRRLADLVQPLDQMAQYLLSNLRELVEEITQARGSVQTGSDINVPTRGDPANVDIFDLARQLRLRIPDPQFQQLAQQVMDAIGGPNRVVIAEGHLTSANPATVGFETKVDNAHGLGIYFPASPADFDPLYHQVVDLSVDTQWNEFLQEYLSLFSDTQGPLIEITFPRNGATIQNTRPTITALIRDQGGGRVDPGSIRLIVDGQEIDPTAFTFDIATGLLTYTPPSDLAPTAHTLQLEASDIAGNPGQAAFVSFRVARLVLPRGLQMISIPLRLSSDNPLLVFGTTDFLLARWRPDDPSPNKYHRYPDPFATLIPSDTLGPDPTVTAPPAGLGYWVRLGADTPLLITAGEAVQAPAGYRIRLRTGPGGQPGWNMIGDPFNEIVGWSGVLLERGGERLTVMQAVQRGWTNGILYEYVPNPVNPDLPGHYEFSGVGGGAMQPWKGYWVLANQEVTLIIPPTRSRLEAEPPRPLTAPGGWQLRLEVRQGGIRDPMNFVGIADTAQEGLDAEDILEPPPLPGAVRLSLLRPEGRYAREMKATSFGAKTWEVEVETPQAGEVTLTWEGLRQVPGDWKVLLEDRNTGRQVSLRTQSGYTYLASAGEVRRFRLQALPQSRSPLAFQWVGVVPGRGRLVRIAYRLNQPAQVGVEVCTLQGQTLWRWQGSRTEESGEVIWPATDAQQRPLPQGVYLLRLRAQAEEGQAHAIRIITVF